MNIILAKTFFKLFLYSALLPIITALLTDTINSNSLITFPAYFYLTAYCIWKYHNKTSDWVILLALVLGRCLPDLNVIYGYIVGEIWSLPLFVLTFWGIFSGYLYWRIKNLSYSLPLILGCIFATFMFFQGWDYWIHKSNFGTFTGKVSHYNLPTKFEAFNQTQTLVTENDFNNKIVLLDFWTTSCGICFQKFPKLQNIHVKYRENSDVIILAVNIPIEEDTPNQAFEMIEKREYSFPVVITKDKDMAEKWGVVGYPTTFVINQTGQIVYKGDIEGAILMVEELASSK